MINKIFKTTQTVLTPTVKAVLIQNMFNFLQVLKISANASVFQKNSSRVNPNKWTTEKVCFLLQLQKHML